MRTFTLIFISFFFLPILRADEDVGHGGKAKRSTRTPTSPGKLIAEKYDAFKEGELFFTALGRLQRMNDAASKIAFSGSDFALGAEFGKEMKDLAFQIPTNLTLTRKALEFADMRKVEDEKYKKLATEVFDLQQKGASGDGARFTKQQEMVKIRGKINAAEIELYALALEHKKALAAKLSEVRLVENQKKDVAYWMGIIDIYSKAVVPPKP